LSLTQAGHCHPQILVPVQKSLLQMHCYLYCGKVRPHIIQDDLPICPTLTPAWIRSGQPASSWFTPSPESAASVAGKGQIALRSMINIFPFDRGNVNDTTIHTDHHITVLNINLQRHRATCLVSQCAGILI
jgi:hypothetical protein